MTSGGLKTLPRLPARAFDDMPVPHGPWDWQQLLLWVYAAGDEQVLGQVVAHERTHIRQGHSPDILLIQCAAIGQWFNPFIWLYKTALRELHEYLADRGVLAQGFDSYSRGCRDASSLWHRTGPRSASRQLIDKHFDGGTCAKNAHSRPISAPA
ncbi:MAG TPA: M56 family metallopeptidase [Vicinamibacterales bacterium]